MKNIVKIMLLALCLRGSVSPLPPLSGAGPIPYCYPNPCISGSLPPLSGTALIPLCYPNPCISGN